MINKEKMVPAGIFLGSLVCSCLLVLLDRWSKVTMKNLLQTGSRVVIPRVLSFSYVENTGAAFNLLDQQKVLFLVVAGIAAVFVIFSLLKTSSLADKTKEQNTSLWIFRIFLVLVLSGAVGNAIDRLIQGYVIDFIHVTFINFPVFNLADCYVVVGCIVFFCFAIFRRRTLDDVERSLITHGRKV